MLYKLILSSSDIGFIQQNLPYIAGKLDMELLRENRMLTMASKELQDWQDAIGDVLLAYGFDENYDANAVGRQAENLLDSIQSALKS